MDFFKIVGRYFWLVCLGRSAYQYFMGLRSLASKDPTDPRTSAEAVVLRRWFVVISDLPWIVMGWGIMVGGVPNIWYFLQPRSGNPYRAFGVVLPAFSRSLCGSRSGCFFFEGAEKVVVLQPFEIKWHRTGFRGTTRGIVKLTVGRVKLFTAIGPFWIAFCTYLMSVIDAPLPK